MPVVGFCLSIRVHPANPPLLPVLYVFTLGSVNATASSRVSALQWSWPFGPIISRNLYQSRGCYGVTKCPFVGQGGRCKVQENPIGLLPTTYIYTMYIWLGLIGSLCAKTTWLHFFLGSCRATSPAGASHPPRCDEAPPAGPPSFLGFSGIFLGLYGPWSGML